MLRSIVLAIVCSLFLESIALAQESLGALREGFGSAEADAHVAAFADDTYATLYFYDFSEKFVTDEQDVQAEAEAEVIASDAGASSNEFASITSRIDPPSNTVDYVPQAKLAIYHRVGAWTDNWDSYAYAGGNGFATPGGMVETWASGRAGDAFLIDDGEADCPCLTGLIDLIVTRPPPLGTYADAGSYLETIVDRAEIIGPIDGSYEVKWDTNVVFTIDVPPGGSINMVMTVIDCNYENPTPLSSYASTNVGYGRPTYAYAFGDDGEGEARVSISVLTAFEAEDYPCGSEPCSPQLVIQHYEGEGENREPVGDPIYIDVGGGCN